MVPVLIKAGGVLAKPPICGNTPGILVCKAVMLFGMNTTKLVIVMPLRLKVGRLMTPEFACVAMPGVLKPPILIWGVLINGVCIVGSVNPPTVVPAGIVIGGTVTDGILN